MPNLPPKDYYEVLGLPKWASPEQINSAYRALAVKYHPDTSHESSDTIAEFKHITEAHRVLSDPAKRRHYDRLIAKVRPRPITRKSVRRREPQIKWHGRSGDAYWADAWHEVLRSLQGFGDDSTPSTKESELRSASMTLQCELPVTPEEALHGATVPFTITIPVQCPMCHGSGIDESHNRQACDGQGFARHRESLAVPLPQGIAEGAILQFDAKSYTHGTYRVAIRVRVRPHW